ncbi:MAG: HD domain-containing protein [bacterium]|nr:HD domain-containing protein [bacterium]
MQTTIYNYQEARANFFNMISMLIMAVLGLLALLLNEVGIFTADKENVRNAMIQLCAYALVPFMIYIIHDKIKKCKIHETILEKPFFKIIIIVFIFLCVTDLCIALSFQATLLLAIPPIVVAQYKNDTKLLIWVMIATVIMVPIVVYGSFFMGMYDANLLKPLTQQEALELSNRARIFTLTRAKEIFFHYALTKLLCVVAIDAIAITITRRNSFMIDTQVSLNEAIVEQKEERNLMQQNVIEDLADVVETRDLETGDHIKRTKLYVNILANALKNDDEFKDVLDDETIELMTAAAPLHDIGKIGVSDLILCKKGRLNDEEFNIMKTHTTIGGEIIDHILNDLKDERYLNMAHDIALYHHEKWNGMGYPCGLKEDEIPLSARIMAIADVFDALISKRCYKEAMPIDDAINIIIKDAGSHFDPNIVRVFKTILPQFKEAAEKKL